MLKSLFLNCRALALIPAVVVGLVVAACQVGQAQTPAQGFATYDAPAKALLSRMTLEEKVGQMCQPDQDALKNLADIEKYFLGSLLSGGGSGPKNKADYNLQGWTDMVDGYQRHALKTRLGIPLIYGVDAVHGHNNIPGAVIFPHNIGLGCARDAKLVEQIERITAEEVRATGINWVFAPCVTVPRDIRWGRTYEGYSESPDIVQASWARPRSAASRAQPGRSALRRGLRQTLRRRRRHGLRLRQDERRTRPGPGRHPLRRGHAPPHPPARICHRGRGGRRPPSCPPTAVGTA